MPRKNSKREYTPQHAASGVAVELPESEQREPEPRHRSDRLHVSGEMTFNPLLHASIL